MVWNRHISGRRAPASGPRENHRELGTLLSPRSRGPLAMATPRSGGTMPRTHHVVSRPPSPGPPGNRDNQDCPQETWCWGNPCLDYRVTLVSSPHPAPGLGHLQLLTHGQPERALDLELSPELSPAQTFAFDQREPRPLFWPVPGLTSRARRETRGMQTTVAPRVWPAPGLCLAPCLQGPPQAVEKCPPRTPELGLLLVQS